MKKGAKCFLVEGNPPNPKKCKIWNFYAEEYSSYISQYFLIGSVLNERYCTFAHNYCRRFVWHRRLGNPQKVQIMTLRTHLEDSQALGSNQKIDDSVYISFIFVFTVYKFLLNFGNVKWIYWLHPTIIRLWLKYDALLDRIVWSLLGK